MQVCRHGKCPLTASVLSMKGSLSSYPKPMSIRSCIRSFRLFFPALPCKANIDGKMTNTPSFSFCVSIHLTENKQTLNTYIFAFKLFGQRLDFLPFSLIVVKWVVWVQDRRRYSWDLLGLQKMIYMSISHGEVPWSEGQNIPDTSKYRTATVLFRSKKSTTISGFIQSCWHLRNSQTSDWHLCKCFFFPKRPIHGYISVPWDRTNDLRVANIMLYQLMNAFTK